MNKLLALLLLAFFAACSVTESESDSYSKWEYSGYVLDASSGKGLSGATITFQDSDGRTVTAATGEDGSFFIDKLPYGSLSFSFSHTEINGKDTTVYAPKVITVGSTNESSSMHGVVASISNVIRLSPLNASIAGEFYIRDPYTGAAIPVSKAAVWITHEDTNYINLNLKSFSTKTDSLGKFKFSGLPADSGLLLNIAPYSYKNMRFILPATILPRLEAKQNKDIGRAYLTNDTLIAAPFRIKASNVMDSSQNGYKNVSTTITPYFVFTEALSEKSLNVTMTGDSAFILTPTVKGDTLFVKHDKAFPANTEISTKIVAYTKKNNERIEIELSEKSAFTTDRGLYAVTSNLWPENEHYRATFSINDTMWVKFSETLATNTERIQWHYANGADRTIYANGFYANAKAWVRTDTLFVQMQDSILASRNPGDTVGFCVTVYAKSGLYLENALFKTELVVPPSSSSTTDSTTSSSSAASSDSVAISSSSVDESSSSVISSSSKAEESSSSEISSSSEAATSSTSEVSSSSEAAESSSSVVSSSAAATSSSSTADATSSAAE